MSNKYMVHDMNDNSLYMVGTVKQIRKKLEVSDAVVRMAIQRRTNIHGRYRVIILL